MVARDKIGVMKSTSDGISALQNEDFWDVARYCVTECCAHYDNRLLAIYVWGSVHRGEAVQGVSDLDLMILTTNAPSQTDEQWRAEVNIEVEIMF